MLTKLRIQNYALIDHVKVSFTNGLTTITGETGAGKSILLGGLGLILGNRADSNAMMDPSIKCVIEGEFDISKYNLKPFFEENDLDFENQTLIRRELLPGGKSRAFVNDSPVRLEVLTELQSKLIDVHSQHQTLLLNEQTFQFEVIDAIADAQSDVSSFRKTKAIFELKQKEFETLKEQIKQETIQHDYHFHLYQELQLTGLKDGELETLEADKERLTHMELIQSNLMDSYKLLNLEEIGIIARLYQVKLALDKIKNYAKSYTDLFERIESAYIELSDLNIELSHLVENEHYTPEDLEFVNARLQILYNLMQKHRVNTLGELLTVFDNLAEKVKRVTESDSVLKAKENELIELKISLAEMGNNLHSKRMKIIPQFEKEIIQILRNLGMQEAVFQVQLDKSEKFSTFGTDTLQWLFSANKGNGLGLVKQVASGGEMSRIMLAIKSVLAGKANLPTIIFDEIDSGISGEIAIKMSEIMKKMATDMQVICITHLPQIASKGEIQLKVYKENIQEKTQTSIKILNENERLQEIAEMLGGKNLTQSALDHASVLLNQKAV